MNDIHSPAIRSKNMRAIRGTNTRPELQLRKLLCSHGFRFRIYSQVLPGKPDIVLPEHRVVIFVHGCFWHGHGCYLFKLPHVRREFWQNKIGQNRLRDERNTQLLKQAGWRVLYIWECSLRGKFKWHSNELAAQVANWILCGNSCGSFAEVAGIEVEFS